MSQIRKRALTRLAVVCLGTGALTTVTLPALAASFSVGGGAITTTQADNSVDNTATAGGFALQPNTTGSNDVIAISGVTINNTIGAPSGHALDLGYTLSASGPYSVTMQGSNLTSTAGSGVAAFIQSSAGGNISFDSTGGAANTISGSGGTVFVESFGTINATNNAIAALTGTGPLLRVTLESSSVTSGRILGDTANDTFNILTGANISGATFDGAGGLTHSL